MDYKTGKGDDIQGKWSKIPIHSHLQDTSQVGFRADGTKKETH